MNDIKICLYKATEERCITMVTTITDTNITVGNITIGNSNITGVTDDLDEVSLGDKLPYARAIQEPVSEAKESAAAATDAAEEAIAAAIRTIVYVNEDTSIVNTFKNKQFYIITPVDDETPINITIPNTTDTTYKNGYEVIFYLNAAGAINIKIESTTFTTLTVLHKSITLVAATDGWKIVEQPVPDSISPTDIATNEDILGGEEGKVIDASHFLNYVNTYLNKQGKESVFISAGSMRPTKTNGCSQRTIIETTANTQPDLATLDFDASVQEYAQYEIFLPKSYNLNTVSFMHIWTHGATTTNFGVTWGVRAVAISDDEAAGINYGSFVNVSDTGGTTNKIYVTEETAAVTIANTPAYKDMYFFQISRIVTDANDNLGVDAKLIGTIMLYTTNKPNDD